MIRRVCVVIPAANEQDHLRTCLDALAAARLRLSYTHPGVSVRTVVVLDRCTDGSATITRGRTDVETVTVGLGRVGAVRAAGTDHVLHGSDPNTTADTWLANTDADSVVPIDWLTRQVVLAASGARVVLGTVRPGPGLTDKVSLRWCAAHVFRTGHPYVHGANLGIRADTYRSLGGWPDLSSGEDQALAALAASAHVPIARPGDRPVITSTRLAGRAPRGFSSFLRGLAAPAGRGAAS